MAPMAPTCPRTKPSQKQNPYNYELGNHWLLPHITYGFLVVLKGGGKSVHILKEECLKELIMWLQEFIPPPLVFFVKWIVWRCLNDESSSHSLILANIWIQWFIGKGKNSIAKEISRGTFRRLFHKCRYVVPNQINEGTSWFFREQKTILLQC